MFPPTFTQELPVVRIAKSAREAPVNFSVLVVRSLGATVRHTPSRASTITSHSGPNSISLNIAFGSAINTRQCCHVFAGMQMFPPITPFVVHVAPDKEPPIRTSPPVPEAVGSSFANNN